MSEFQTDDIVKMVGSSISWAPEWNEALYKGRLFRVIDPTSSFYTDRMEVSPLSGGLPSGMNKVTLARKYFKKL